MYKDIF